MFVNNKFVKFAHRKGEGTEGSSKHVQHDRYMYVMDRREHDVLAFSRQTSCYFWSRSSKLFQKQLS